MSGQEGWGGNTYKLHWIKDGRALCGTRTKNGEIEQDVHQGDIIFFGCWTCKARLARRKEGMMS